MGEIITTAVVWFEKGLQVGKLEPTDFRSKKALPEAVECYAAGLVAMFVVMNLVFFIRTGQSLNKGEVEGISLVSLLQLVNTALFVVLFINLLHLLRVHARFREVTMVCCYALGGMLPIYSLPIGYFLYPAIQLAAQHRDIWAMYVTAAIWQAVALQQVATVSDFLTVGSSPARTIHDSGATGTEVSTREIPGSR